MRRVQIVATIAVLCLGGYAHAGLPQAHSNWHAFWHRFHLDAERNNAYPEPFRYADRQIVRSHWAPYIAKGWQVETTLTAHHFDPDTALLNSAGEDKLRWILTAAPEQRRAIFVVHGENERVTESRVDVVQQAVTRMLPSGPLPSVIRTYLEPAGITPTGEYQNNIWKKSYEGIQAPTLPAAAATGTGTP